MENLAYQCNPISNIKALSGLLQIPEDVLIGVSNKRDMFYYKNKPEIKPDGSKRITYRLNDRLKIIQKRINNKIFNHVVYPEYLQGSIKDKSNPRTYERDASIHAGSHLIISEDVSNFFHSISEKHVKNMWKYLFGFSVDVSEILTKLTTYNGYVPQGGVTSSYISNLILWDLEPKLIEKLNYIGVTYTRFVDDITLSPQSHWLPQDDLEKSIKLVYTMLAKKGLKPNRQKHKIMSKANKMVIHKLNVNSGKPTIDKRKRRRIRLELFNLKKYSDEYGRNGETYVSQYDSLTGKVRELSKFHPAQGEKYLNELEQLIPDLTHTI